MSAGPNHVPGPGRPRGSKSRTYITIQSVLEEIQSKLGCEWHQAYAELLLQTRELWESGEDKKGMYIRMMEGGLATFVEKPKQMPADTTEYQEMTDEQLKAKATEIAKQFLEPSNVLPFKKEA